MSNTKLEIYKSRESAIIPEMATEQSACFDICACIEQGEKITYYNKFNHKDYVFIDQPFLNDELYIEAGERFLIPTGLIFDIPVGYSIRIHPRSGLAIKQGLSLINCEGVIDSDYVNEVMITVINHSMQTLCVKNGDRLCQGELVKSLDYEITETLNPPVQKTNRIGGFGSTGV